MTSRRPFRRSATVLAAATSLTFLLGACSDDDPVDDTANRPATQVHLDPGPAAPDPVEELTIEPADAPTVAPGEGDGAGEAPGGQAPVEVTGDMRGPDSAAGYDPDNPMPVGLTVDEWAVEWDEGQQVAAAYMQARYAFSYTDPHPSQWLVRTRDLSTPEWYRELQKVAVQSQPSDAQWARAQEDELVGHIQMLDPLTLDTARPFGRDEMWVRVPYRTWETNRLSRAEHPTGWDMDDRSWGAQGAKFTLMHLVHDKATDRWLVNEEGVTQMSPIDH